VRTDVAVPDIEDSIAIITLDNPSRDNLSCAPRGRLLAQLEQAHADPAVRGIVLAGNGNAFSACADVFEFCASHPMQEPSLRAVLTGIEAGGKPVVAAVAGAVPGSGLELALACHGRVAHASARIGLTEITFGLIPDCGGTQRLPRLVGIAAAYALMAGDQPRAASELRGTGLFDETVSEDVVAAAVQHAITLINKGAPYARARDRALDPAAVEAGVASLRNKLNARQKMQPAYEALLDALAAAALPFDDGLQRERELVLSLVSSSAARALRYQFMAGRDAVKAPADSSTAARAIRTVAVVGAGTMGTGIAIATLDAGLAVLMIEQDAAALDRGQQRIVEHYRSQIAKGKLTADDAAENQARFAGTLEWARLRDADLVIEAVFEDLSVKQSVFRKIDAHARSGAVLATNTSYLDVDAIAAATSRPQDVLGLHFFSPANVMKLLEVVRGARTSPVVIATGMALGSILAKTPVLTGNAFGFIGNRIYNAYRRQCEFMLEDGAWPEDVDNALTDFGFAMGPFSVADLSGLDIAWRMRQAQAPQRDPRERYVDLLDQLCEMGRLGRKASAGYYRYAVGKRIETTDHVVRELILRASARRGIARRTLTPDEIRRRALLAMVNEAAHLLADGIAARPGDIDVVMVQGYGFPRWEGGPVFWARQQDRVRLEADMEQLAAAAGYGFVVADLTSLLSPSAT
jgi:3-hydroxyacyl-CoA dehydrogenase